MKKQQSLVRPAGKGRGLSGTSDEQNEALILHEKNKLKIPLDLRNTPIPFKRMAKKCYYFSQNNQGQEK